MKIICFFITHKTLGVDHAECCFRSISIQETNKKFDKFYIYNTHQDELSNEYLMRLYSKYELNRFFDGVEVFNYDPVTHKSLGGDISTIRNYVNSSYDNSDRVLLLKSDCLLSKNYFDVIMNLENKSIYFTAPFICAKKRVTNTEIFEYLNRDTCILSDDITFFVEDTNHTSNNDFNNRKDVSIYSDNIKFTSCYVVNDYSCHYISKELLNLIRIEHKSWGGANFNNLIPYLVKTDRCFVVHKYHDIISDNRTSDREGPVSGWLNS